MSTAIAEQQPIGVGTPNTEPVQQSPLAEVARNADTRTIEDGKEELQGFVEARQETPTSVDGEKGEPLLKASGNGIPSLADLSLPEKEIKPIRWHHFRAHIEKAIIWISETLLRRNKMQAKEDIPTPVEGE